MYLCYGVSRFYLDMFAKVFGERNTGTNFLVKLLKLNTNLTNLTHPRGLSGAENFNRLIESYPSLASSRVAKQFIRQRLLDSERKKDFSVNYGWKHAALDYRQIQEQPRFADTLFLCLVRNPWRFTSALHRRPYNYLPEASKDLKKFITSPLITNERDGLVEACLETPVDLWNKKVLSYFDFASHHPVNVQVVYYEQIISNIDSFFDGLLKFCDVNVHRSIPQESTKKDAKSFTDYKREVENYSPVEALGNEVTKLISERIDKRVFQQTIYNSLDQYDFLL